PLFCWDLCSPWPPLLLPLHCRQRRLRHTRARPIYAAHHSVPSRIAMLLALFATTTVPLDDLHRVKMAVAVVLLSLFWCWETWRPFFGRREGRWRHAGHNLCIALFNTAILGLMFGFITTVVARWTENNHLGLFNALGLVDVFRFG